MSTIVVSGALANRQRNGGEAWVRLNGVLCLRRREAGVVEPGPRPVGKPRSLIRFVQDRLGYDHRYALDPAEGPAGIRRETWVLQGERPVQPGRGGGICWALKSFTRPAFLSGGSTCGH